MLVKRNDSSNNLFETIFLVFIIVQPIIDLITSLAVTKFESEFTAGVFIRFFMMAVGVFYIFFITNSKKKMTVIYILILGLFLILGLVNNLLVKSPIDLVDEIKFILKAVYFVLIFFSYLYVFRKLKNEGNWELQVQKYIVYSMTIVGVTMVIAALTNTAFSSYTYNKVGHVGWFYAGNELGAVMSICFPIVLLYALRNTHSIKTVFYWIPTILLIYGLMAIGTKVGFGSVFITIVFSLAMLIIEKIRKKETVHKINIVVNIIVLLGFALYTPFSPVAKNMNIHLSLVDTDHQQSEHSKEEQKKAHKNKNKLNDKQIENLVLSGRGEYLEQFEDYFAKAPITQKMLGMGYAGNYTDYIKLIEMDFHDLFFAFGIIGFLIYLLSLLYFLVKTIIRILFNFKTFFTLEIVLVSCGILLGLGIAYTAGHVLYAPAVSIYLAILIAYLYLKVTNEGNTTKGERLS